MWRRARGVTKPHTAPPIVLSLLVIDHELHTIAAAVAGYIDIVLTFTPKALPTASLETETGPWERLTSARS